MTPPDRRREGTLPEPVLRTIAEFEDAFGLFLRLLGPPAEDAAAPVAYRTEGFEAAADGSLCRLDVAPRDGSGYTL